MEVQPLQFNEEPFAIEIHPVIVDDIEIKHKFLLGDKCNMLDYRNGRPQGDV